MRFNELDTPRALEINLASFSPSLSLSLFRERERERELLKEFKEFSFCAVIIS